MAAGMPRAVVKKKMKSAPVMPGTTESRRLIPLPEGVDATPHEVRVRLHVGIKLFSLFAALQSRLLDHAAKLVRPGGRLLYATCSIFPQEGEQQAMRFLETHADAARLPAPGQLLPLGEGQELSDGFFYALFAKQA